MGRTIPFLDVRALRRLREFQAETGPTLEEIRQINYWTDIDWKRRVIRVGDRDVTFSERAHDILTTQFHAYGELWSSVKVDAYGRP